MRLQSLCVSLQFRPFAAHSEVPYGVRTVCVVSAGRSKVGRAVSLANTRVKMPSSDRFPSEVREEELWSIEGAEQHELALGGKHTKAKRNTNQSVTVNHKHFLLVRVGVPLQNVVQRRKDTFERAMCGIYGYYTVNVRVYFRSKVRNINWRLGQRASGSWPSKRKAHSIEKINVTFVTASQRIP